MRVPFGVVHSATGPLASEQPLAGLRTAVATLNSGEWYSGRRPGGFAFGNSTGCTFEYLALDDASNASRHDALVQIILPRIDALLGSTVEPSFALPEIARVSRANTLQFQCCESGIAAFPAGDPRAFSMASESLNAATDFLLRVALSSPNARVATLASTTAPSYSVACAAAAFSARRRGLRVVLESAVDLSAKGTWTLATANATAWVWTESADVVFVCMSASETHAFVRALFPLGLLAIFVTSDMTYPGFDTQDASVLLNGVHFNAFESAFSSTSWVSSIPSDSSVFFMFKDDVFGFPREFAAKVAEVNPGLRRMGSQSVTSVAAAAAASVVIMFQALQDLGQTPEATRAGSLRAFLENQTTYDLIVGRLRSRTFQTTFGITDWRRGGPTNPESVRFTVQIKTVNGTTEAYPVVPQSAATSILLFPVPSVRVCSDRMGLASLFDQAAAFYQSNVSSCLSARERGARR